MFPLILLLIDGTILEEHPSLCEGLMLVQGQVDHWWRPAYMKIGTHLFGTLTDWAQKLDPGVSVPKDSVQSSGMS